VVKFHSNIATIYQTKEGNESILKMGCLLTTIINELRPKNYKVGGTMGVGKDEVVERVAKVERMRQETLALADIEAEVALAKKEEEIQKRAKC